MVASAGGDQEEAVGAGSTWRGGLCGQEAKVTMDSTSFSLVSRP